MNEWAYAGRKVVCIIEPDQWGNPSDYWRTQVKTLPEFQKVYTIRSVEPDNYDPTLIGLRLQEVVNPPGTFRSASGIIVQAEPQFNVKGFRPVDERPTDISVFTKMLRPALVDA